MGELFADIVLPVAAPGTFTYRVPERLEALLKPGSGVLVRFGRRKEVAGVVARIHSNAPVGMKTRDIDGLTGAEHLAGEVQLKLWNWIAEYYMCTPGEVMNAAIPSSLLGSTIPSKTTNAVLLAQGNDHQHIDNLRRRFQGSPAKMRLLDAYLELSVNSMGADSAGVEKSILLARAKTSATTLNQMVDEGIFTIEQREVTSMDTIPFEPAELSLLNDEQDAALRRIEKLFGSTSVALLKGVTSSGKTEIYFHLIAQTIAKGKQALYLLPEIALTSQMINRLRNHFGEDVGVYHSGLTEIQRAEVWRRTAGVSGQPPSG